MKNIERTQRSKLRTYRLKMQDLWKQWSSNLSNNLSIKMLIERAHTKLVELQEINHKQSKRELETLATIQL